MRKALAPLLMAMLFVAACGGGGDNPPAANTPPVTPPVTQAPQVLTGIFVDAPVEGITFVSGAQTGATDASGSFKFEAGGTVQFKVGKVVLGEAPAKTLMTPVDLVKAVDATATVADSRVVQIVQFLMTCNANPPASTTMSILAVTAAAAQNEAAVDLSQAPVNVTAILGRIVPAKTPVTTVDAAAHIQGILAALGAPKTGAFAAVDSATNPTLGIVVSVTANAVGNAFVVTGKAVSMQGATWDIIGTMTTDGAFQATGTGTGAAPPANMTLAGSMTAATQLTITASFTQNGAPKQIPLTFEKAVAPAAAAVGKFGLPSDPGVPPVAGDVVHMAAGLIIKADGTLDAHLVQGQVTGVAALAQVYNSRYAGLLGVVTGAGNIIAIGGIPGDPDVNVLGEGFIFPGTASSPIVIVSGALNAAGTAVAANMTAAELDGGVVATKPLAFAQTGNALAGVYRGTHSDTAPGLPSTFTFGVNNDNSVHGFAMFLRQRPALIQQTPFLLDGVVDPTTGALAPPPGFNLGGLGTVAAFPGLVMMDNEAATNITPGTFSGTITAATGTTSGSWQTGPGVLTTGTFSGSLVP